MEKKYQETKASSIAALSKVGSNTSKVTKSIAPSKVMSKLSKIEEEEDYSA